MKLCYVQVLGPLCPHKHIFKWGERVLGSVWVRPTILGVWVKEMSSLVKAGRLG